jgi:spore coat protein A
MKMFLRKLRPLTVFIGFAATALVIFWGLQSGRAEAQGTGQVQLPGSAIPQFVDKLPDLSVTGVGGPMTVLNGTSPLTITMREFKAHVLPTGTFTPGVKPETWVWGYISGDAPSAPLETYIGPVIVAQRGTPTQVTWVNALGNTATSHLLAWKDATDQTLHWADPKGDMGSTAHYAGPIPAVVHLHGGEVPPELDGGPDAWFLSSPAAGYTTHGHAFYSRYGGSDINYSIYNYPNTQEAANIWFHDHVLGATRLNVYAGLAGAYVIMDDENDPKGLAGPIVPLVIQDRSFDTNGQLLMPNLPTNPTIHPFWTPEFVGDTIVVNGKVWPFFLTARTPALTKCSWSTRSARSWARPCTSSARTAVTSTLRSRSTPTLPKDRCSG